MLGTELDPGGSIEEAYIATKELTFCSKYIEIADWLSKEVGEDNPRLIILFELKGRVDKRTNVKIWTKWFGMC